MEPYLKQSIYNLLGRHHAPKSISSIKNATDRSKCVSLASLSRELKCSVGLWFSFSRRAIKEQYYRLLLLKADLTQ
ncbi:Uncharacterized protein HZ326_24661 [Fusarium oxysporum f. sp. albedinis]|nr:Uncharacterized protein HZ326_24661 [Fusarium oxysporum f. sp. albedinis]